MLKILKMTGFAFLCAAISSHAYAQLPANPWQPQAPSPNDGYFGDNASDATGGDITDAPIYANSSGNGEILPVDPWARARDRSGIRTWRGSGQQGKLNYIGEGNTYATGDLEMLAPEVNRHNMIVMLDHLRKMGYNIPQSYDEKIKNMPSAYREELVGSVGELNASSDPFSRVFVGMLNTIENSTGLDLNNILFNTIDILGTD